MGVDWTNVACALLFCVALCIEYHLQYMQGEHGWASFTSVALDVEGSWLCTGYFEVKGNPNPDTMPNNANSYETPGRSGTNAAKLDGSGRDRGPCMVCIERKPPPTYPPSVLFC